MHGRGAIQIVLVMHDMHINQWPLMLPGNWYLIALCFLLTLTRVSVYSLQGEGSYLCLSSSLYLIIIMEDLDLQLTFALLFVCS
jgi:ABC-type Fe3+ transport system permease subunit